MFIRFCLVLSISVVWLCSAASNHTVLTPFIEKSASLARISAAISIHNGIYSKKSIVQEVTAEFLNISPLVAKELLEHDYSSLSTAIQKFHGSLSKIPARVKDGDGLIGTIDLLLDMKKNQEYLKPGTLGDQTAHFSKTKDIMIKSVSDGKSMLAVSSAKSIAELLRKVKTSDPQKMKTEEIFKILSDLVRVLPNIDLQLNLIINYKTVLKDYLSLETLTNDLENVENAAEIAGKYSETIKKLDPYRQELIAASTDTDKIKESVRDILKYSESVQRLFPTSILFNSTAPKYEEKILTSGLLGYKDLDNVWKDFENPWIEKNFLNNMDPTPLKLGLEDLKLFISSLDTLPSIQKLLDNENEKKKVKDLAKKISKVHELGSKVLNVTNIKSPYEDVSNCIEPLKPIKNPPDLEMLQRIVVFSDNVVKGVKAVSELMDHLISNGLENTKKHVSEIYSSIRKVSSGNNESELIGMWNTVHKIEKDQRLAHKFGYITERLNGGPKKPFREDASIDYSVIKRVSTVFEDTNVESVLACIKRQSVKNLIEMLGFVDQSDSLTNQKGQFKTTTNYVSNLLKIQKNYQEVITKMKNAKVSKESQALIDSSHFKDIGTNSKLIGSSVAALRALESISRAKKSIRSVVEMDSDGKIAIQKSLGPKSTDDLIREMTQAQNSMGEILKVVKTKRIDSISDIQFTFISLSQLKDQTDIKDENILNVAFEMSSQPDPKLQSYSKDFLEISNLDLRFVNHQKAFRIESSLEKTKKMLVDFLQTFMDEQDADKMRTTENSSYLSYIVSILPWLLCGLVIATVVICFICWYRGFGCWHFVESEDLESGKASKQRKLKFGLRRKGRKDSKSKMSKPMTKKDKTTAPVQDIYRKLKQADAAPPEVKKPRNPEKKDEKPEEPTEKKINPALKAKLQETQENLQKLRTHAKRCVEEHKSDAASSKFQKKGAIWIPNKPEFPPPAPLPQDIQLEKVEFCAELNERWDIGSDVDAIEFTATTEDEESTASRKSKKSKKSKMDGAPGTPSSLATPTPAPPTVPQPAAPSKPLPSSPSEAAKTKKIN
ncbi:unnamed protein product [Caenorhabditis nigoni]